MSAGDIARHFNVTGASVDVRVLKDILGHEQLNTTQIYTHVSNRSMEDAMNENPLAKVKKNKL
ncbi:MAG: tyrosine-type recombinase/integrase [Clostridia bacterium]|nr:tyrosine-type recombinase/integrase [Clostridia bacterium]